MQSEGYSGKLDVASFPNISDNRNAIGVAASTTTSSSAAAAAAATTATATDSNSISGHLSGNSNINDMDHQARLNTLASPHLYANDQPTPQIAHTSLDFRDVLNHDHPRHATMALSSSHPLNTGNGVGSPLGLGTSTTIAPSTHYGQLLPGTAALQDNDKRTDSFQVLDDNIDVRSDNTPHDNGHHIIIGARNGAEEGYITSISKPSGNSTAQDSVIDFGSSGKMAGSGTLAANGSASSSGPLPHSHTEYHSSGGDGSDEGGRVRGSRGFVNIRLAGLKLLSFHRLIRHKLHQEICEFIAIAVYLAIGIPLTAQHMHYDHWNKKGTSGDSGPNLSYGMSPWEIFSGWGMAIMAAGYICIGTSGGHINPAVTLGLATVGKFPWRKVPGYIFAQITGAIVGALFAFVYIQPLLSTVDGGTRAVTGPTGTASWFVPMPSENKQMVPYSMGRMFWCEIFGTFVFLLPIQAQMDRRIRSNAWAYLPIAWGIQLTVCLWAFGTTTPVALNPARDLGPRIVLAMVGYGNSAFSAQNHYFWIPLIGPIVGSIAQGVIYLSFIRPQVRIKFQPAKPICVLPKK
ncbi:glycerol channel [Mycoemilia scoparia]|uniref:Glycerol channel n=1 Tax=Mycoemilia scoparia TaxID=417184 RepID=A0A9W8DNW2_9FUNG|nr:glycerol channel [Mycoemilia scoparia]